MSIFGNGYIGGRPLRCLCWVRELLTRCLTTWGDSMRPPRAPLILPATLGLAAIILAGCQPRRAWHYVPEPPARSEAISPYSLVVLPFADERGDDNADLRFLSLIPLWPYGQIHYDRPEGRVGGGAADPMVFDPQVDLREAIAADLRSSGIFKEVRLGTSAGANELELRGTIEKTEYQLTLTYYGLSIPAGPLLSLFLPNMKASNALDLRLQLTDPTGAVLWTHTIKDSEGHVYWIYQRRKEFMWDELLKEAMPTTVASLSQVMQARQSP